MLCCVCWYATSLCAAMLHDFPFAVTVKLLCAISALLCPYVLIFVNHQPAHRVQLKISQHGYNGPKGLC